MKDLAIVRFLLRRKGVALTAAAFLLVAVGALALRRTATPNVATAEIKRGEFVDYVQIRGEIKALHSVQLAAPSIAGDLQIVKMIPTGTMVKAGDVVVQFDPSNLQRTLEQALVAGDVGAVLFVDIDHFKYVNDNFGHRQGDQLIVGVSGGLHEGADGVEAPQQQSERGRATLLRDGRHAHLRRQCLEREKRKRDASKNESS